MRNFDKLQPGNTTANKHKALANSFSLQLQYQSQCKTPQNLWEPSRDECEHSRAWQSHQDPGWYSKHPKIEKHTEKLD